MPATTHTPEIRLTISRAMHSEIRRVAELNGRSLAGEVTRAIRFYLANFEQAEQELRQRPWVPGGGSNLEHD